MRAAITITTLLLLAMAAPARAQSDADVAEAKRYYQAGVQAYGAGQYLVAIAAFEEAYKLSPRPSVMFSLAQAYRRQYFVDHDAAKLKRAVDLYRDYVAAVEKGERRDEAVRYLGDLEPLLARVEEEQRKAGKGPVQAAAAPEAHTQIVVTSRTRGARAALGGGAPIEVPAVFDVQAGTHAVRVEAPGYHPEERQGIAVEGRLVVLDVPLKEKPARVAVRGPAGARVAIDGRPAGTLPLAAPLEVPAGRHFVAISRRGRYPYTEELQVALDQQVEVDAALRTTTQRKVSYGVLGGAAALAVAGGVATWRALVAQGEAEDIEAKIAAGMGLTSDELEAHNAAVARYDDWRGRSLVLFGVAGAAAVTGALLWFFDHPEIETPRGRVVVGPTGGGGVGASYTTRF